MLGELPVFWGINAGCFGFPKKRRAAIVSAYTPAAREDLEKIQRRQALPWSRCPTEHGVRRRSNAAAGVFGLRRGGVGARVGCPSQSKLCLGSPAGPQDIIVEKEPVEGRPAELRSFSCYAACAKDSVLVVPRSCECAKR